MALLYDSFSVRYLQLKALLFPTAPDRFPEGLLSQLWAAVNTDDTFDDCSLRQRLGAIFEGERITFEIEPRRVEITMRRFEGILDAKERIRQLLATTESTLPFKFLYLPDTVELSGLVPDDKSAVLIERARTKMLKLTPNSHFDKLPGHVMGTGIDVFGHNESLYTYNVTVAPFLTRPENLYLEAKLDFNFPDDVPENDLDSVIDALQTTYDFLTTDVVGFAQTFMP